MGMRRSDDPNQAGRALFVARPGGAPLSELEAARPAVFAALDGLVEVGLAAWHGGCSNGIELRGIGGEAWLLDDSGVTRVR
jgi:hypothetical protein